MGRKEIDRERERAPTEYPDQQNSRDTVLPESNVKLIRGEGVENDKRKKEGRGRFQQ